MHLPDSPKPIYSFEYPSDPEVWYMRGSIDELVIISSGGESVSVTTSMVDRGVVRWTNSIENTRISHHYVFDEVAVILHYAVDDDTPVVTAYNLDDGSTQWEREMDGLTTTSGCGGWLHILSDTGIQRIEPSTGEVLNEAAFVGGLKDSCAYGALVLFNDEDMTAQIVGGDLAALSSPIYIGSNKALGFDGETVLAETEGGTLTGFGLDGTVRFVTTLADPAGGGDLEIAGLLRPLSRGRWITDTEIGGQEMFIAFEIHDGVAIPIWSTPMNTAIYRIGIEGLVTEGQDAIYAISSDTGATLWSIPFAKSSEDEINLLEGGIAVSDSSEGRDMNLITVYG